MVVPNPSGKPHPILGDDNQVIGYVVPAEQMKRMQDEIASLREQLARAEVQRDLCSSELDRVLKSWMPMPPTEEEMAAALRQPMVGSNELAELIAELEGRQDRP